MAENYDLIFGQAASQQYAWSDSDYQNGWQIVDSTPPTAEQFDALQRKSDTKAKDLNDRLSPLEEKAEADGRQAATSYTAGAMLTVDGLPNGWLLECIVPGISGTDAITLPENLIDGLTIIDGGVTWALREVATNGGLGYRQPSTAYTAGQIAYHSALPTGLYLECTTAGTTSSSALVISSPAIGGTVSDGTVKWAVCALVDNAAAHNAIYRGVDLTAYFESGEMSAAIANGSFVNIYPGDYIIKSVTIDGTTYENVKWIVMDLDYHLHSGDTETTAHHVVLMPETAVGGAQMNTSSTAANGYSGSAMCTSTMPKVATGLVNAFGADHVLEHRELLTNGIHNVVPSGFGGWTGASATWAWSNAKVNLANENMVYGAPVFSSSGFDTGECDGQFSAFKLNHGLINTVQYWWLRAVAYGTHFCLVGGDGSAAYGDAAASCPIRPYFLLK